MNKFAKKIMIAVCGAMALIEKAVTVFADENATPAPQQSPQPQQLSPLESMLPTLIIYGLFILFIYFLFRKGKKKEKQEEAMRSALQVGDEVIMTGGIIGKIINIKDDEVTIETGAARTQIKFVKNAVARVEKKADADSQEKSLNDKKAELQRKLDEKKEKNKEEE